MCVIENLSAINALYEKELYCQIVEWATTVPKYSKDTPLQNKFTADVINTLVDAVVFEPTDEHISYPYDKGTKTAQNWKYVGGFAPVQLNSYLKEYASASTKLVEAESVTVVRGQSRHIS